MTYASLRGHGLSQNTIFNLDSPQNRDNCFEPYAELKKKFSEVGIDLNTSDIAPDGEVQFELHQDFQSYSKAQVNYLLMLETNYISPQNQIALKDSRYRRIFTWRDDLVDGDRFIKIQLPNPIVIPKIDGWVQRSQFACLIAGNKTVPSPDGKVLYQERVDVIRWFEQNAPQDFFLYGIDWDIPVMPVGFFGKVLRRIARKIYPRLGFKPFPSYCGKVNHKQEVLLKTRFSICYENVRDLPGYITEKIFDCFFSGCIPVYWGANNVTDHIPRECFIDRRDFHSNQELYDFLKSMPESEFITHQEAIASFMKSDAAQLFGSKVFARTIVDQVVSDLEN